LSAKVSIRMSTVREISVAGCEIASQGWFRKMRSVYLSNNPTMRRGMYAFSPVLAERPKADKRPVRSSILELYSGVRP